MEITRDRILLLIRMAEDGARTQGDREFVKEMAQTFWNDWQTRDKESSGLSNKQMQERLDAAMAAGRQQALAEMEDALQEEESAPQVVTMEPVHHNGHDLR